MEDEKIEVAGNELTQESFDTDDRDIAKILGCTENEVVQLCAIFQKESHELPEIFESLDWSAERVLKLDRTLSPVFIAVKLKLDNGGQRDGACVAMCLVFDASKSVLAEELYLVTHGIFPDWFSVKKIWEKFRVSINKIGGDFERSLFNSIRTDLKSVFTIDTLRKLANDNTAELRSRIYEKLAAACVPSLFPQKPHIEMEVERFGVSRLTLGGLRTNTEREKELAFTDLTNEKEEVVCVTCSPIIDPVNGKAASELSEGDYICVELMDGPGMTGIIYRLLNKIKLDTMFPVISAEVSETGAAAIKFLISEEITGIVRVPKEVRLKASPKDDGKKMTFFAKIIPLFSVVFLLFLVLLILYYLIR